MAGDRIGTRAVASPRHEPSAAPDSVAPVISVVMITYKGRDRIDAALSAALEQDCTEPYEVIVVASGGDGCADHVRRAFPAARVVDSPRRLWPAAACNRGVREARGRYVAFLGDDCVAAPDWLRGRLRKHREGFAAVGGAITNGSGWHPVGLAGYLLEYAPLMPVDEVLAAQGIPHALSYDRSLFETLGPFPEDVRIGEDTVFNRRCVDAGVAIGLDARIRIAHRNPTGLLAFLRHQWEHGRGLAFCIERHGLGRRPGDEADPPTLRQGLVDYPWRRLVAPVEHLREGPRRWLLAYCLATPLMAAGALAAGLGRYVEARALRRAA
jgi:glycosyltransferase involved in cell wall biosynthesis